MVQLQILCSSAGPVQLCWIQISLLFPKVCDAEGNRDLAWLFNFYSHHSGFYLL